MTLWGDRRWFADVKALGEVDAELAQEIQRRLVLDPLGDGPLAEAGGQRDDPGDHGARSRGLAQVAHELHVDLEIPDRQVLEIGEGRIAGAEVIEREEAADLVEALGEPRRLDD